MTSASARFKKALPNFCDEGKKWAERQPNLKTAWARCQNGNWMAWWLQSYCDVCGLERLILIPAGGSSLWQLYETYLTGQGWLPQEQRLFADAIRAHYSYTGRRLK